MINNIVNLQQYKLKKQAEAYNDTVYDFYTMWFNMFLRFYAYPMVAAVETAKRNRITIL